MTGSFFISFDLTFSATQAQKSFFSQISVLRNIRAVKQAKAFSTTTGLPHPAPPP